jgi:2-amino-4-hydroxy-6-hydroxymethyldihydropteridine diphosphokinase
MKVTAFIGLGANLDDPAAQVKLAFEELARLPHTILAARSSLYVSAPVGCDQQPDFINAVAKLETGLSPRALLAALLDIEHLHGRERTFRNAPRTLDLDLLLFGDALFHEQGLAVPHPRMHERSFVLEPLMEIAPDLNIPGHGSLRTQLTCCAGQPIRLYQPAIQLAGGVK